MTNYEALYAQFQLDACKKSELKELHEFYERHHVKSEKFLMTTSVSDTAGTRIVKSEVSHAKLV